jgi:hypothetical protein
VTADVTGVAHIDILDPVISLQGEHSQCPTTWVVEEMRNQQKRAMLVEDSLVVLLDLQNHKRHE